MVDDNDTAQERERCKKREQKEKSKTRGGEESKTRGVKQKGETIGEKK